MDHIQQERVFFKGFRSFQIDRWAQLLVLVSVHVCDCDVCVHECVHCELAYVCNVCVGTSGCGVWVSVHVYYGGCVSECWGRERRWRQSVLIVMCVCCWRYYQLTGLK